MLKSSIINYYLGLLLLFSASNVFAAELLHQSDFTYVGAFKLPGGVIGQDTFEYSSGFVAGNVYNDPVNGKTIFATGYLSAGYVSQSVRVAQIKIPSSLAGSPTATSYRGFQTRVVALVVKLLDRLEMVGSWLCTTEN